MSFYHGRDVTRHLADELCGVWRSAPGAALGVEGRTRSEDLPDGRIGGPRAALSAGPRDRDLVQLVSASRVSAVL